MTNTIEDYPTSLRSMILGPGIMEKALSEGIAAAIADRDAHIEADRKIQDFDNLTVLVTAPRIAYYGLQKKVLRGLGQ